MSESEAGLVERFDRLLESTDDGVRQTALLLANLISDSCLYSGNANAFVFYMDMGFIGEKTADAARARIVWNLRHGFDASAQPPDPMIPTGEKPAFSVIVRGSEVYRSTFSKIGYDGDMDQYRGAVRSVIRSLLNAHEMVENHSGVIVVEAVCDYLLRTRRR